MINLQETQTQKSGRSLVVLASLVYFASYLTRLNFGAVLVEFLRATGQSPEVGGLIGSALFFAYGFGQLISGYLGDRLPPQHIVLGGIVTTTVCNVIFPLLHEPVAFITVWGINGLAQAMFWPPCVRILAQHFEKERYAAATSAVITVSQLTNVLIYLLVPALILTLDWRFAFFIPAAVCALVGVLWVCFYRSASLRCGKAVQVSAPAEENTPTAAPAQHEPLIPLLISCGIPFILLAITSQGILRDGITTWMPTALNELYGMGETTSILMSVLLPIFGVLTVYAVSFLYRRFLRNEVRGSAIFFAIACAVALLLFFTYEQGAVIMALLASLITGLMHGINLLLISYLPARFASRGIVSTVSGITNAFTYVGSTLSTYLFALLATAIGWDYTILVWSGVCLLGLVLCLLVAKRWSRFTGTV